MDGVMLPFLPASVWLFAVALAILILLIFLGFFSYVKKKMAAIAKNAATTAELSIKKDQAELLARKQQLEADVGALRDWIRDHKIELESIKGEREQQERDRAERESIKEETVRREADLREMRKEAGELENNRHMVTERVEELKELVEELEKRVVELKETCEKLENGKKELLAALLSKKEELDELERKIDDGKSLLQETAKAEIKHAELVTKLANLENEIKEKILIAEQAQKDIDGFKQKLNGLDEEIQKLRSERSSLRESISELQNQKDVLNAKISVLKREEVNSKQRIKDLDKVKNNLEEEVAKLKVEVDELRRESVSTLAELSALRTQIEPLRKGRTELEARLQYLKGEIEKSEDREGRALGETSRYDDLLITIPPCLSENKFLPEPTTLDETALLDELKDSLDSKGLKFSNRILYSFHTSLKCHSINPLTVLAGVSGTGKTLLPMQYAQIMGMHSLVISVQPRWDSPQDMFGFYNYLEKKYKATDLARSLIRMDQFHDFEGLSGTKSSDRMLLVLMDEMNLARTEYYFSEFLSKLELRKQGDREKAEIAFETGPGTKKQFRVWVGDNILFVGTMNEDETTQTLSDKVLDRANVLRFGKPTGKVEGEKLTDENDNTSLLRHHLTLEKWLSWIKPYSSDEYWVPEVESWIDEINNILNGIGRPFGYRVQKTIKKYIVNYPGTDEGSNGYKFAFADQVEQKIIPKLRGLDLLDHKGALQEIYQVIQKLGDDPLSGAFISATEDSTGGMFVWRGVSRPVEN